MVTQPLPVTWVEVDLEAILRNAHAIRRRLAPTTQLLAVVKANAYGHGLLHVAETLAAARVADALGVASLTEGIALRNHGLTLPILVMGPIVPEEAPLVARHRLTQAVCTRPVALALARAAQRGKDPIRVHLKVDTGMGRYGVPHQEALAFARWLRRFPSLLMEGLFTHLACADADAAFTQRQLALFRRLVADCERSAIYIPQKHAANSMGLLAYPEAQWDLVRAGLALYGISPKAGWTPPVVLTPALAWKSRVALLKSVPAGTPISYGATYRTARPTRIATIPVGYAHGYSRRLSNRGQVSVGGRRAPVVGRVTMDHLMVDIGARPGVQVGSPVTLLGRDRAATITADHLAAWSGTIPYETLCGITPAVPRRYLPIPSLRRAPLATAL
ncbi:MAG: alanine racemase [Candidatus Omnitrophica bacterium]|nr:alanine racemase [Candidatus Omnitrophota bacterium]